MSRQNKCSTREGRREFIEDDEGEVPTRRPHVDQEEQNEYEEWRKERSERGRKRRRHRDSEPRRRVKDEP